jgi:hypothetical protein
MPGVETKPSGALRSNNQTLEEHLPAIPRTGNRSNYDNVASVQQQPRSISSSAKSSGGQRMSPGRGYEEANV